MVITWRREGCGWDKLKRAQLLNIKAQMSSIRAKGCMLMIMCVCYLTRHDYPSLVEGESHGILYQIVNNFSY